MVVNRASAVRVALASEDSSIQSGGNTGWLEVIAVQAERVVFAVGISCCSVQKNLRYKIYLPKYDEP